MHVYGNTNNYFDGSRQAAPQPPQQMLRGRGGPPRGARGGGRPLLSGPPRGRGGFMGPPRGMSMIRPGAPRPLLRGRGAGRSLRLVPMPSMSDSYSGRSGRGGFGPRPRPMVPQAYYQDYYGEEECSQYGESEEQYGYEDPTSFADDNWQEGEEEQDYYGDYDANYGYPTPQRAPPAPSTSFRLPNPMWNHQRKDGGPPSKRLRQTGPRPLFDVSFQEDVGAELMGDAGGYDESQGFEEEEQEGYEEVGYQNPYSYSTAYPLKTGAPGSSTMLGSQGYNAVPPPMMGSSRGRRPSGGGNRGRGGNRGGNLNRGGLGSSSRGGRGNSMRGGGRGGGTPLATSQARGGRNILQKQEDDKREYSEWLEKKQWLHQAIPGTVKKLY